MRIKVHTQFGEFISIAEEVTEVQMAALKKALEFIATEGMPLSFKGHGGSVLIPSGTLKNAVIVIEA